MDANDEQHDDTLEECAVTETRRSKPRPEAYVTSYVNMWIDQLNQKGLEFVTEPAKLVEQIRYFNGGQLNFFKTKFRRTSDNYVHPKLVRICDVLNGSTRIWTAKEKKDHHDALNAIHNPRGVDTNGDKETGRTHTLFDLFPTEIKARYKFRETVRGCLVDMIVTDRKSHKSFGIQIATSESSIGKFNFHKIIDDLIQCINKNIVIILIAIVNGEVAGVYLIPPTSTFTKALAGCKGSMCIAPTMLSKQNTSSKLNKALQQFRYICEKFKNGVKGTVKDLKEFPTKFQTLCDDYSSIVNTPAYLSSLYNSKANCTEWAGNVSYEINVLALMKNVKVTIKHGARGDLLLEYDDGVFKFVILEERKTWTVGKSKENIWQSPLRHKGRNGLHPLNVGSVVAFLRSDPSQAHPSNPNDFPAFTLCPVLTADGELAMRPDDPSARALTMTCNVAKKDEYIRVKTKMVGANMYPGSMQKLDEDDKSYTLIKAVFYYDDLRNPDGKRLRELLELYTMFSTRKPKQSAIDAYESAVNDELIDQEKRHIQELKMKPKKAKKN